MRAKHGGTRLHHEPVARHEDKKTKMRTSGGIMPHTGMTDHLMHSGRGKKGDHRGHHRGIDGGMHSHKRRGH